MYQHTALHAHIVVFRNAAGAIPELFRDPSAGVTPMPSAGTIFTIED